MLPPLPGRWVRCAVTVAGTLLCLFPHGDPGQACQESGRNFQRYPQGGDLPTYLHFVNHKHYVCAQTAFLKFRLFPGIFLCLTNGLKKFCTGVLQANPLPPWGVSDQRLGGLTFLLEAVSSLASGRVCPNEGGSLLGGIKKVRPQYSLPVGWELCVMLCQGSAQFCLERCGTEQGSQHQEPQPSCHLLPPPPSFASRDLANFSFSSRCKESIQNPNLVYILKDGACPTRLVYVAFQDNLEFFIAYFICLHQSHCELIRGIPYLSLWGGVTG